MVMQTTGVNYYTPGWNNGTYIPPAYTVANPYAGFGYGCCGTAQTCCC